MYREVRYITTASVGPRPGSLVPRVLPLCGGLDSAGPRSPSRVRRCPTSPALVLPGPGVTALIARVLARGLHGAPCVHRRVRGRLAGVSFAIAATRLAVLAAAFASVFVAIRYAGAAYLLYLALEALDRAAPAMDAPQVFAGGSVASFSLTGVANQSQQSEGDRVLPPTLLPTVSGPSRTDAARLRGAGFDRYGYRVERSLSAYARWPPRALGVC